MGRSRCEPEPGRYLDGRARPPWRDSQAGGYRARRRGECSRALRATLALGEPAQLRTSWHRWTVLALLACALLSVQPGNGHPPAGQVIPLTRHEISRLLTGLQQQPPQPSPACSWTGHHGDATTRPATTGDELSHPPTGSRSVAGVLAGLLGLRVLIEVDRLSHGARSYHNVPLVDLVSSGPNTGPPGHPGHVP